MRASYALLILGCLVILHTACEDPYIKRPLAKELDSLETGINASNIARLQEELGTEPRNFSFAVTSDSHVHYDALNRLLDHIRSDTSVKFILVCGDITDDGTMKQMRRYVEIMAREELPYVTAIGNREHQGTGRVTFETMFGSRNSQFVAGGVRFILFDNVATESDVPVDFDQLRTTLASSHEGPTIVAMHIQPSDPSQLPKADLNELDTILAEHPPDHVFMGHNHSYEVGQFGDTPFTTVSWPKNAEYVKVTIEKGTVTTELVRIDPFPIDTEDSIMIGRE